MTYAIPQRNSVPWRATAASTAAIVAAMALGQIATLPNLPWYEGLNKPGFTPPNFVFGPVWTALYVAMGYASYRIARLDLRTPGRRPALVAYALMLALNVLWTFAFFGSRSPASGLVEIVVYAVSLIAAIALFARVDRGAAAVLAPIALWVAFAGALNFEIWRLN